MELNKNNNFIIKNKKKKKLFSNVEENLFLKIKKREIYSTITNTNKKCYFQYNLKNSKPLITRLKLDYTFEGHEGNFYDNYFIINEKIGCVNTIQWSSDGNLLISGSDDTQIYIWDYM